VIRTRAICTSSGASAANTRHSTYRLRHATIAYRWHPLAGRTFQVSPHRRGKDLKCIYTDERPDLCRELPNWMFDESYCAGMELGLAQISINGLNALAAVLASLGETRPPSARSHPSKLKEKNGAQTSKSQSSSARSGAGATIAPAPMGSEPEGTDRSPGRPSTGGPGHGEGDDDGRRG
jgi:hypothetical protein